jgi:hypothetical protein
LVTLRREDYMSLFIKTHPGCTKTEVVDYMDPPEGEKLAAPKTTFKILKTLIQDNKVILQVDHKNNRIHHLFLNEKHRFVDIQTDLTIIKREIEDLNRGRKEETERLNKLENVTNDDIQVFWDQKRKNLLSGIMDRLIHQLRGVRIYIKDPEDRQVLNDKILDYMLAASYNFPLS